MKMPYKIISEGTDDGGGFWVQNQNTGRRMNKKPLTKKRALAYLRALEANMNKNEKKHKAIKSEDELKPMERVQAIHDHSTAIGADCDEAHMKSGELPDTAHTRDVVQAIHDHAHALGAEHADDKEEGEEGKEKEEEKRITPKAMKYMMDMGADEYAEQESWDVIETCQAIIQIAQMIDSEIEEPEDLKELQEIGNGLIRHLQGEWDEIFEAASQDDEENGEDDENVFEQAKRMRRHSSIKIAEREDVDKKEGEDEYGDVEFADEKNKKYPIDTEEHIRAAWNYINKEKDSDKYSAEDVARIKGKIESAWKEKIDKAGPPSAEEKKFNFDYAKSLGLSIAKKDMAVKFVGRDEIWHRPFIWGSEKNTDVSIEYFTKSSNFWDDRIIGKRPLTWDHAQDSDFKASPVIGMTNEWGDDEIGRWAVSKLDRSHKYRKMIDKLIDEGILGSSSDSAPQYVERVQTGKATWLKTWPWFATALTDVPCEPRMIGSIEVLKRMGITLPNASDDQARLEETLRLQSQAIQTIYKEY